MCWQLVMGRLGMRMMRLGGCTARHSAALARHHSCAYLEVYDLTLFSAVAFKRGGHVLAGGDGLPAHGHVGHGWLHRQAHCCIAAAPLPHVMRGVFWDFPGFK